jgi:hypothetical protein
VEAGATWHQVSNLFPLMPIDSITLDPAHPSTLYGAKIGSDVIYRSDDGGFPGTR